MTHRRPRRRDEEPRQDTEDNLQIKQIPNNKRSQSRRAQVTKKVPKDTFLIKVAIICVLFFLVIITIAIYQTFFHTTAFIPLSHQDAAARTTNYENDERKDFEVLREIVANAKDIIAYDIEMANFADGLQLDVFLEKNLQPIQNRITSLQTQAASYEKMGSSIPGGPVTFIDAASKELKELMEQMHNLYAEAQTIIKLERKKQNGFKDIINDIRLKVHKIFDLNTHPRLIDRNIILLPIPPRNKEWANEMLEVVEHQTIVSVLEDLADQLELLDESFQQIAEKFESEDYDLENDPELQNFKRLSDIVQDLIENGSDMLMLTVSMHSKLAMRIDDNERNLMRYIDEKRRALLDLKNIMMVDNFNLQKRIQNLRYESDRFRL